MKGFDAMDKKIYVKRRKIISKSIMITMYIGFVFYVLGDFQSIADWNYGIHEMLYVPVTIAYYILPMQILLWLFYCIRSFGVKKDAVDNRGELFLKNIMIVISLVSIVIYIFIQGHTVNTGGFYEVNTKVQQENNYYIILDQKKVKCTRNEYNLIVEDKFYLINYEWNTYWPDQGKLVFIKKGKE